MFLEKGSSCTAANICEKANIVTLSDNMQVCWYCYGNIYMKIINKPLTLCYFFFFCVCGSIDSITQFNLFNNT